MMLVALLPTLNEACCEYVDLLAARFECTPSVIIPAILESMDIRVLRDLRARTDSIYTFSTDPQVIHELHQQIALKAATQYELGRAAISVHCQNVCDLLKRRYKFDNLRDIQVARILDTSDLVMEVSPRVYKSKVRFRDKSPKRLISHWAQFLRDGGFRDVYDLPSYCSALSRWFDRSFSHDEYADNIPNAPVTAWLEYNHRGDTALYLLHPKKEASLRITSRGDYSFLRGIRLADVLKSETEKLDDMVLKQVDELERVRERLAKNPRGEKALKALYDLAVLWLALIRKQDVRGQSQKWRGWYLVPEHGPLTVDKLSELQLILQALNKISNGGSLLLDKSSGGVANAVALLKAGRVRYSKSFTDQRKRDLFIRQQKNYLVRLGLAMEPVRYQLALTDRGRKWLRLESKEELVAAFREVLKDIRWTWCNMPFFDLLCELADRCDGKVTYRELFNWVIHAYDWKQLDELVHAIRIYRALSFVRRQRLDEKIENRLKSLLDRHISSSAFGHYRTKVRELMVAFASSGMFRIVQNREAILIRTLKTD